RDPQCLRDASKAFLSLHRVTQKLPQLCKRPACSKSEPRRGLTCIRWGAYGAAGFSGVKDARKSVLICRRFSVGCLPTSGLQKVNRKETTGLQKADSRETPELRPDYIPTTQVLQRSPNSGDIALWDQAE